MRKLVLFGAIALLASCAHSLKSPEDLRIGQDYPMIGNDAVKLCQIKVKNVATVAPSQMGPLPLEMVMETKAMVCGPIDCEKVQKGAGSMWKCVPFELLQSSKSE